ncbi:MAG TPA: hypothetical protein VLH16_02055, partial [Bacteroidales bacterium]|nr:hypothetical protein [Bacteroidales bacterium]
EQIVVSVNGSHYMLREGQPEFNMIWTELSAILQEIDATSFSDEIVLLPGERACVYVYFNPLLPLGSGSPWLEGFQYSSLSEIQIICRPDSTWLQLKDSERETKGDLLLLPNMEGNIKDLLVQLSAEEHTAYKLLEGEEVGALLGREVEVMTPIYVPLSKVYLSEFFMSPENTDQELLVKTFFVDPNLARVIEERDGGLIYTDGKKGLRLTGYGFQYSHPRLEEGQTSILHAAALTNSSTYISYHGGWPQGLRLDTLAIKGSGRQNAYEARWRMYHQGYPIYTSTPTRALFNDRGLVQFTRAVFEISPIVTENAENIPVQDWSVALKVAAELLAPAPAVPAVPLSVETLHLGYVVLETALPLRGVPVWVVQLNGEEIFLNALDLVPLNKEDLL